MNTAHVGLNSFARLRRARDDRVEDARSIRGRIAVAGEKKCCRPKCRCKRCPVLALRRAWEGKLKAA